MFIQLNSSQMGVGNETSEQTEEIESHFAGKGYGHLKTELAEAVIQYLKPFQAKMAEIDDATLEKILKASAEKAHQVAGETLKDVYQKMGVGSAKK